MTKPIYMRPPLGSLSGLLFLIIVFSLMIWASGNKHRSIDPRWPGLHSEPWFWVVATGLALAALFWVSLVLRYLKTGRILRTVRKKTADLPRHFNRTAVRQSFVLGDIEQKFYELHPVQPQPGGTSYQMFLGVWDHYHHSRYGRHRSLQSYYIILRIPLPRTLPHILFDSHSARKRQFRWFYSKTQRLLVQGGFDKYFDTYVPETYHIDSLSFVTPEVMEALVAARFYDMEIVDDSLFLYGPLMDEAGQSAMVSRGLAVAEHLSDNIDTYRDDRLTGVARQKGVHAFGRVLLRSTTVSKWLTATGAILVVLGVGGFITNPEAGFLAEIGGTGLSVMLVGLISYASITSQNKQMRQKLRVRMSNSASVAMRPPAVTSAQQSVTGQPVTSRDRQVG